MILALILAAAMAHFTPSFPFSTWQDVEPYITNSTIITCGEEMVSAALVVKGDDSWGVYVSSSHVMIFAGPGDTVSHVGMGTLDVSHVQSIPPLTWVPTAEFQARYAHPCDFLFPVTARAR